MSPYMQYILKTEQKVPIGSKPLWSDWLGTWSTRVRKQLEARVIHPAASEWAAHVPFISKKDSHLRISASYRKLDEITLQ